LLAAANGAVGTPHPGRGSSPWRHPTKLSDIIPDAHISESDDCDQHHPATELAENAAARCDVPAACPRALRHLIWVEVAAELVRSR
jgi:hypothetical protein